MFTTKLTRAAHRATSVPASCSQPSTACISCVATARQPSHQRRQSSSKTSWPPDSASKPAPAAKAGTGAEEAVEASAPQASRQSQRASTKGRPKSGYGKRAQVSADGKKEKTTASSEPVDQFAGLPSVPSIQNLSETDRGLLNFFSLHRPMSLTSAFPPTSTQEAFNSIFVPSASVSPDPWANGNSAERRPEDVIYTLHNTIESLDSQANAAQDESVRWEVISESNSNAAEGGVRHLDPQQQPRMKSLEELVQSFKPFKAPPAPEPFAEHAEGQQQQKKSTKNAATKSSKAKQKTFTATITVTESTDANGQKTYSASSSPITRIPEPSEQQTTSASSQSNQQRTLHTAARRSRARTSTLLQNRKLPAIRRAPSGARVERVNNMVLISVKRQRKLKMKKHKYKKLMKRTRNIRRKLDRL